MGRMPFLPAIEAHWQAATAAYEGALYDLLIDDLQNRL
jgi:hypothetical protein